MNISFNAYNEANKPRVFLSLPNRKFIANTELNVRNLVTTFRTKNGISYLSFKIYKYANMQENDGYDEIVVERYIWLEDFGWYKITNIDIKDDGENPYKEVKCSDLVIELKYTKLTSFGSMGKDTDEQGGLDRYALYDANDQSHSIAHIFMAKNPSWTFKYIDEAISKNHRSFDVDSISSYEFLTGSVAESFECIFTFDSNDRTVSAYKVENLGKRIPLLLSFYNLIKEIDISWNSDDIRTVLHVSGGNDATGTALSIAGVNAALNDSVSNFSFFYNSMSTALRTKLEEYYQQMEAADGLITTALSQLKVLQDALAVLNSHDPSVQSSTNWSEYGLTQLKAKATEYLTNMSIITDENISDPIIKQQYDNYNTLYTQVNNEIAVRQTQITAKETEITAKKAEASSYGVDIYTVLGADLYNELQPFVKEDTLCDDSFIVTDSMTDNQILEMKQELYNHGVEELNRICYPQFDMTIDSVNFAVLKKYQDEVSQLELGDIITLQLDDDNFIEARLLEMELDWEDFTKFKLKFSSKTSLEDGYFEYDELYKMADSASSTITHRKSGYNGVTQQANDAYYATQQEFLDLSKQQLLANANDIITEFGSTGILLRKFLPDDNKFAPEKMWITNRQILLFEEPDGTNLKTPKLAIGKVYVTKNGVTTSYYGISADVCYGKMFFGQSLTIQNTNNTLTMDENGFKALATNGFSVQINPDTPDNIFTISENTTKLMYIDAVNRKLVFQGRIEAIDGHIGGWTIGASTLTSGGVGMSSTADANGVSFWAGNASPTSAPFRVLNSGYLYASNANISGVITATSGTIGGWRIENQNLVAISQDSQIQSGQFWGDVIGVGSFYADNDYITFCGFQADDDYLMSSGEQVGIRSAATSNQFWLWAGYNGMGDSDIENYAFAVDATDMVYARELTITGSSWWKGWTLTDTMIDVYDRLDALEAAINP